jgi:histidinol-phosphate/aromatic aminotransferase/cobyric acid decarboxylase-like protein
MDNWLRISIGTQEEIAAFAQGLREIVPVRRAA